MKKSKLLLILIIVVVIGIVTAIAYNIIINKNTSYDNFMILTNEYPHNADSFTQGLFVYNDVMYETCGLYGESKLHINIDTASGRASETYAFDDNIFAEGSTILNDKIYVLTYKENKIYKFDLKTLILENEYEYLKEGWGLTTDGKYLIVSDGSSKIYYLDENLNCIKELNVTLNNKPIYNINELEYINGKIWANIWYKDYIIIINPDDGRVLNKIDFKKLKSKINSDADVLNGIAYNKENNKLYITGKKWNKLFEFELK